MTRTSRLGTLPRIFLCVLGSSLGRALAEQNEQAPVLPMATAAPAPSRLTDTDEGPSGGDATAADEASSVHSREHAEGPRPATDAPPWNRPNSP